MRRPLLLLALATLAGCQKDDASMSEESFCAERALAECERLQGPCALATLDGCVATRQAACAAWADALSGGTHMFRPQRTRDCLAKVRATLGPSVPIAAIDDVDATCARVFEGTAVINELCQYDFDCVAPLTCDVGKTGLCATRREVASGGGCANPGEICRAGEFCGPLVTQQGATLLVCAARVPQGGACSAAQPCLETLRCLPGGTCAARLTIGLPCVSDGECATSFCDPYVHVCSDGLHFAPGSASCVGFAGQGVGGGPADAAAGG